MEIIVTEVGSGIAFYKELHDWAKECDCNPDDENFEALSMLEGDPDKVKCGSNETYYLKIEREGKIFIVTSDEPTEGQREILKAFYSPDWKENFTDCTIAKRSYEEAERAITYLERGGYFCATWIYTPKKEN